MDESPLDRAETTDCGVEISWEVRWFGPGPLPDGLIERLRPRLPNRQRSVDLDAERNEVRIDHYLIPAAGLEPDLGMKLRGGQRFEVKHRTAVENVTTVSGRRVTVERWHKASGAMTGHDGPPPEASPLDWVPVHKSLWSTAITFDERRRSADRPDAALQVARVTVPGAELWTVGVDAWERGSDENVESDAAGDRCVTRARAIASVVTDEVGDQASMLVAYPGLLMNLSGRDRSALSHRIG